MRQQLLGALVIQAGFTLIGVVCRVVTKDRLSDRDSELRRITLKYLRLCILTLARSLARSLSVCLSFTLCLTD